MLHMLFGLLFFAVAAGLAYGVEVADGKYNLDSGWRMVLAVATYGVAGIVALLGIFLFVAGLVQTGVDLWYWIEGLTY